MKKYILTISAFLLVILFSGCEKDFDGLVEPGGSVYKITSVSNFTEVYYGLQDSTVQLWIQLENDNDVSSVICSILDPEGDELKGSPVKLTKNEGKYSGNFTFSFTDIVGQYTVNYYITDKTNGKKLAASHYFNYDNGQSNAAPVITNLVAPDTVALNPDDRTEIFLSVNANDSNGKRDINLVFMNSFIPPDYHPAGSNPFKLHDDGLNGDVAANDGIYTLLVYLPSSGVTLGTYRWEFQAQDRRGLLSEKIIHNIVIK